MGRALPRRRRRARGLREEHAQAAVRAAGRGRALGVLVELAAKGHVPEPLHLLPVALGDEAVLDRVLRRVLEVALHGLRPPAPGPRQPRQRLGPALVEDRREDGPRRVLAAVARLDARRPGVDDDAVAHLHRRGAAQPVIVLAALNYTR